MDRKDIKNVPRLDDKQRKDLENVGRPTSDKSILARQSEIKNKIIDEQESTKMSEEKRLAAYLGISDSLIEAVKKVMKNKEEKDDDKEDEKEKDDEKDDDKEEKLSGKKTQVDTKPSTKKPEMAEELSPKQKKHIDKNKNGKIDSHDFKLINKDKSKKKFSDNWKPYDKQRNEETEQIDELIGKGNLKPMMKHYTRERDAAVKDKDIPKAKEIDKKVTRATRMFGHAAALKAVRQVFPNIKKKEPFYGPKYKKSDVKEANDSEALAKINKIAGDMKDMAKQPIKPIKKDPKMPHVNDGAPEMFKIKNESLIESIKKMVKEPKHQPANPNDAVKGVKSSDAAGQTHLTDNSSCKCQ